MKNVKKITESDKYKWGLYIGVVIGIILSLIYLL